MFLQSRIQAYRVANGLITVDGKPDLVWKELAAYHPDAVSQIQFNDYRKIVLLGDSLRNLPPELRFTAPDSGSVTMISAYDQSFLYFLFIVRENSLYPPAAAGCAESGLWKANAVDIFLDPSAWSETLYSTYFTADAGEASYGTSPKSIEVAKPSWPGEEREFYRDRKTANTFQFRNQAAQPSQLLGVAATRTPADTLTLGVEIRIPISSTDYSAGKSSFISWGYNHSSEGSPDCEELPIAYRWAKHVKSYEGVPSKPPGWVAGDSIHYDPIASYDGWGRFTLVDNTPLRGVECEETPAENDWDLLSWSRKCAPAPTALGHSPAPGSGWLPYWSPGTPARPEGRDLRGRWHGAESPRLLLVPIP